MTSCRALLQLAREQAGTESTKRVFIIEPSTPVSLYIKDQNHALVTDSAVQTWS